MRHNRLQLVVSESDAKRTTDEPVELPAAPAMLGNVIGRLVEVNGGEPPDDAA